MLKKKTNVVFLIVFYMSFFIITDLCFAFVMEITETKMLYMFERLFEIKHCCHIIDL